MEEAIFACNDDWGSQANSTADYPSLKKRKSGARSKRPGKRAKDFEKLVNSTVVLGTHKRSTRAAEAVEGSEIQESTRTRNCRVEDGNGRAAVGKRKGTHGRETASSPSRKVVVWTKGSSKWTEQEGGEDKIDEKRRAEQPAAKQPKPAEGRKKKQSKAAGLVTCCSDETALPLKRRQGVVQELPAQRPAKRRKATSISGLSAAAAAKPGPREVGENGSHGVAPQESGNAPAEISSQAGPTDSVLLDKLTARLSGSRFRWLNETLYTSTGDEAFALLQDQPELFDQYHQARFRLPKAELDEWRIHTDGWAVPLVVEYLSLQGFQQQTSSWPQQPVDAAIAWLKSQSHRLRVADFGCGDAALALAVPQRVACLDLVATQPGVIACNMAATPLESSSMDVAVFCLALMGTDYPAFLLEATRVLKPGGWLYIAEVRSRFVVDGAEDFGPFLRALGAMGYELEARDMANRMFAAFRLRKGPTGPTGADARRMQWPELKPCLYKRR